MAELYAQALWNMAQKKGTDPKKLVADLARNLKASGRLKLLPGILTSLEKLEARNAKLSGTVEVARQSETAHALKEAASYGIHAAHAKINPSLIQGWRASSNTKLVDNSAKRSLIDLYRKVVTP